MSFNGDWKAGGLRPQVLFLGGHPCGPSCLTRSLGTLTNKQGHLEQLNATGYSGAWFLLGAQSRSRQLHGQSATANLIRWVSHFDALNLPMGPYDPHAVTVVPFPKTRS